MAFQMVRSFFGQGTPSRSWVHEPVIDSESFGNQGGHSSYDTGDVGKSANSNWFELARHPTETSELGRKPHSSSSSNTTDAIVHSSCLLCCSGSTWLVRILTPFMKRCIVSPSTLFKMSVTKKWDFYGQTLSMAWGPIAAASYCSNTLD